MENEYTHPGYGKGEILEPRWVRKRFGHFLVARYEPGGNLQMACERCIFNSGVHAAFCPLREIKDENIESKDEAGGSTTEIQSEA